MAKKLLVIYGSHRRESNSAMGVEGGFILGTGCEVPLNCKVENLKAMIESVR